MLAGMLNHTPVDLSASEDVKGDSSQNKVETSLDTKEKAHIQASPQPAEVEVFGMDASRR
jgi:hypothetical protein